MEEMIEVKWGPEETYTFKGTRLTSDKRELKIVWRGRFIGKAPCRLRPDVEYCLKQITVLQIEKRHPQRREYFDVIPFRGSHQREILARNNDAVAVEDELRAGSLKVGARICYVVEPAYEKSEEWFQDCWRKPVEQRLELIRQYAEGCRELRDKEENRIHFHRIDAHRDLKPDNGMIEMVDGKLRVRLIDYASIHLETEMDNWEQQISESADGTYGGFLSPSNTAPEDLHHTGWKVGDTTDVYALGMMLAGMFMHQDGKYFNPNGIWCKPFKPHDRTVADRMDRALSAEFARCLAKYDQMEQENAWIEKALWEQNVAFRWEELPDAQTAERIRRLFVRATRIDPQTRVSLDGFIKELLAIRELARKSRERFPISVYLFKQTDFDQYGHTYAQAAADCLRAEGKHAKALCVRYHNAISAGRLPNDCIACQQLPCRDEQDLFNFTDQINRSNGKGPDMTAFALYMAGKQMDALRWAYEFTGNVYLFCPELPREGQIKMGTAGIHKICRMLNEQWEKNTYIDAHVIRIFDDDGEEESWCTQTLLHHVTKPVQPVREPVNEAPADSDMRPYGQLYVVLPDGSIFLI